MSKAVRGARGGQGAWAHFKAKSKTEAAGKAQGPRTPGARSGNDVRSSARPTRVPPVQRRLSSPDLKKHHRFQRGEIRVWGKI